MLSSTTLTFLLVAALASASPTPNTNTIPLPRQQDDDPTLVIFKTYADASNCRNGQGSDSYTSFVSGSRSQALSGECLTFPAVGTIGGGSVGWDGLKTVVRYTTDFNVTGMSPFCPLLVSHFPRFHFIPAMHISCCSQR